jgi:MFS family permease
VSAGESAAETTRWGRVLFGASLGWLAAYAHFKLPLALPILFAEFGYGRMLAGALMSVFALAGLTLSATVGRGISRRGAGRPLAAAFAVLALGAIAGLAWPQSGAWMLLARALEGIGYAVLAVAGAVIAIDSAAPRHKAMVVALYATWMPFGQIVAVGVAAPAAAAGLWQPLWLVGLAATAALAVWAWRCGRGASPAPGRGARPRPATAPPCPRGRRRRGGWRSSAPPRSLPCGRPSTWPT